jgi:hypothetical protein
MVRLEGIESLNPLIKSLLPCSIVLSELVSRDAGTCRDLPFCAVACICGAQWIPRTAGSYRDVDARQIRRNPETMMSRIGYTYPYWRWFRVAGLG